jgi:hypothetical protein
MSTSETGHKSINSRGTPEGLVKRSTSTAENGAKLSQHLRTRGIALPSIAVVEQNLEGRCYRQVIWSTLPTPTSLMWQDWISCDGAPLYHLQGQRALRTAAVANLFSRIIECYCRVAVLLTVVSASACMEVGNSASHTVGIILVVGKEFRRSFGTALKHPDTVKPCFADIPSPTCGRQRHP